MDSLHITSGQVLLPNDGMQPIDVSLADGRIGRLGGAPASSGMRLDASDLLVLPGIVDIHGDAFERQIQPRPGVDFPADLALADTESQLLANGITTAFHGITLSPGTRRLRSLPQWRRMLDALGARRWTCDMRVHLRWEAYNLDALEVALADIAAGRVHLVAFNDHTPSILKKTADPVANAKYSDRACRHGITLADFHALAQAQRISERANEVAGSAPSGIAAAARAAGVTAGQPRRLQIDCHAHRSPGTWRAHVRIPDGRRSRRGRARGRRLGCDGLPERGARRLASWLGVGGAARGGGHLFCSDLGLFSTRQCSAPR